MRVLAIGAHPDDVELGCGATLAKHAQAGDEVSILHLGSGRDEVQAAAATDAARVLGVNDPALLSFDDNAFDAWPRLHLIQSVENHLALIGPEVVYTHSAADLNIDHRRVHEAVLTACRPVSGNVYPRRILAFEVLSSTEWGMSPFRPTVFNAVSADLVEWKIRALKCYASEMRESPHPRSCAGVYSLARMRGMTAGVEYAEAFELLRCIE